MTEREFQPHWIGDYELLRRVGTGGMAEVFLARTSRAEGFEKVVVVKRMLSRLARDERFVEMFLDEARIAVRLQHANIVQILALEAHEGRPFIVMEYVHGCDLLAVIKRVRETKEELPVGFVAFCLSEALKGLEYAHTATGPDGKPLNLIHRDVSPSNIFISFNGEVKLGDFGVAHQAGEAQGSEVRGKMAYLAPEILRGEEIDARSDIFSAGVVLWEALARRRLFVGAKRTELLRQVVHRDPEPPSTHNSLVSFDLDVIATKALMKTTEERFQTAREMEEALANSLFDAGERWTLHRVAEVMQRLFPDESQPLVLPPPSVPSIMGTMVEGASPDTIEITGRELATAMDGLPDVPDVAPGSWVQHASQPWPESLESNIFEVSDADRERYAQVMQRADAETLKVYTPGEAEPAAMSIDALFRGLTYEPQRVAGVGVVGDVFVTTEELGRLLYWDTLTAASLPSRAGVAKRGFERVSLTRLIYELSVRRMTGLVLIETKDESSRRLLYLENGSPTYVHSDRPQDAAPMLLRKEGWVDDSALYRALVQVIGDRIPLDQALISVLGDENRDTIERAFSAIIRSRFYDPFWWADGHYQVFAGKKSPIQFSTRLPPLLGILVRAVSRALTLDDLEARLVGRGLNRVVALKGREQHVAALRLRKVEQAVYRSIDNRRSLPQIIASVRKIAPDKEQLALATMYVLSETHIVELI